MSSKETDCEIRTGHQIELLIDKYADGTLDDVEASVLAEWVRSEPGNAMEFKRRLRTIRETGATTVQAVAFWHRFAEKNLKRRMVPHKYIYIGIAAAAALLIGLFSLSYNGLTEKVQQEKLISSVSSDVTGTPVNNVSQEYATVYRTSVGEKRTVVLPDSTRVILNSGTKLTLAADFNKTERRAELDGEAFFEIAPDKAKKFILTCGKHEYTVRGTSFNVISYSTDSYSVVTLHTGRLDAQVKEDVIVLKPGDELRMDESMNTISKHVVNTSNSTSWINDGLLTFSEVPLKFVANRIAHKYNVRINVHSSVENILYDGQIDQESLDDALNLLSITALTPLAITEFDGEYYISKKNQH